MSVQAARGVSAEEARAVVREVMPQCLADTQVRRRGTTAAHTRQPYDHIP